MRIDRGPSSSVPRRTRLKYAATLRLVLRTSTFPKLLNLTAPGVQVTLVSDCLKDLLEHELSAIEAQVLSSRYGLDDGAALSWKQIAQRCGMPEKQLQLAQSRALRKLRKQRALRQLQHFATTRIGSTTRGAQWQRAGGSACGKLRCRRAGS